MGIFNESGMSGAVGVRAITQGCVLKKRYGIRHSAGRLGPGLGANRSEDRLLKKTLGRYWSGDSSLILINDVSFRPADARYLMLVGSSCQAAILAHHMRYEVVRWHDANEYEKCK